MIVYWAAGKAATGRFHAISPWLLVAMHWERGPRGSVIDPWPKSPHGLDVSHRGPLALPLCLQRIRGLCVFPAQERAAKGCVKASFAQCAARGSRHQPELLQASLRPIRAETANMASR